MLIRFKGLLYSGTALASVSLAREDSWYVTALGCESAAPEVDWDAQVGYDFLGMLIELPSHPLPRLSVSAREVKIKMPQYRDTRAHKWL